MRLRQCNATLVLLMMIISKANDVSAMKPLDVLDNPSLHIYDDIDFGELNEYLARLKSCAQSSDSDQIRQVVPPGAFKNAALTPSGSLGALAGSCKKICPTSPLAHQESRTGLFLYEGQTALMPSPPAHRERQTDFLPHQQPPESQNDEGLVSTESWHDKEIPHGRVHVVNTHLGAKRKSYDSSERPALLSPPPTRPEKQGCQQPSEEKTLSGNSEGDSISTSSDQTEALKQSCRATKSAAFITPAPGFINSHNRGILAEQMKPEVPRSLSPSSLPRITFDLDSFSFRGGYIPQEHKRKVGKITLLIQQPPYPGNLILQRSQFRNAWGVNSRSIATHRCTKSAPENKESHRFHVAFLRETTHEFSCNKDVWYSYWRVLTGTDFKSSYLQKITTPLLQEIYPIFLFYVDMIITIIPRVNTVTQTQGQDQMAYKEDLEKASNLFVGLEEWTLEESSKSPRDSLWKECAQRLRNEIKPKRRKQTRLEVRCVWIFLDLWMANHYPELWIDLAEGNKKYINRRAKSFFYSVFYYSIGNLTNNYRKLLDQYNSH